ncbi:MAG: phosphate ABC transporter substrate-binding protein [Verrucomicrobiota bacterium]
MKQTIIALFLYGFFLSFSSAQDKIVIRGSDTLGAKLVPVLAEAYKEAGNEVSFEITAEGSSSAFTSLLAGTADIGMSSRYVKDAEAESFATSGKEIRDWNAGYDLIGVIVNDESEIADLSREQIEGIFAGDITDWSEVGGVPGPISVYTRNTSSGTYKSFQEMALSMREYGAETQKMAGNEQIANEVAKNANGIGYVGIDYTDRDGIKAVAVDGIELKPENAADYPLARRLHYYTVEGELSEAAAKFLSWATSDPDAGNLIVRVGFIPPPPPPE